MGKLFSVIAVLVWLFGTQSSVAQTTDSIAMPDNVILLSANGLPITKFDDSTAFKPSPRKAVLFSLIPGCGQIYNRKYWKLPIVYGAFTGLIYGLVWNNQYYNDYKRAYIDLKDDNPLTNSFENMLPKGETLDTPEKMRWFESVLVRKKDVYRRYRDLCIIGMVGMYGLTVLDAYVDAQLFEFDISPNLTLNVQPYFNTMPNASPIGLQCWVNF